VARAGDVICAAAGLYRERVAITNKSGTQASPIVIRGVAGAVLDGGSVAADDGSAVNAGWVRVASGDPVIPGGDSRVWKKTFKVGGVPPETMTWDQGGGAGPQYVLRIGLRTGGLPLMDDGKGADILQNGPCQSDTWGGVCYHDWTQIHAMFGVKPSTGAVYMRFEDGSSPNGKALTFAPRRVGAIHLINSDWITVRDLTIRNADMGAFIDGGSDDAIVQGNTITGCGYGIIVAPWANTARPNRTIITQNSVTLNSLSDMSPGNPHHWFVWGTFRGESKTQFDGIRVGIELHEAGDDILIDGNHVYDHFEGLEVNSEASQVADRLRRTIVRNNLIERITNEGMLLYQAPDVRVYWNRLQHVNDGMRFGVAPGPGPLYIYENTIWNPDYPATQASNSGFYLFSPTKAAINFYHNSLSVRTPFAFGGTASAAGSGICPTNPGYCAPNVHIYNNILSSLYSNQVNHSGWLLAPSKPTVDYNWFSVEPYNGALVNGGHNIISSRSMWSRNVNPYPFMPDTSTYAHGLDLSVNNPACGTACPGTSPGYFDGAAPDIGAIQVK
jgi:hypothetical protein